MDVHFNTYPNPTTVNENVNASFGSFSTVAGGLEDMEREEYWEGRAFHRLDGA